MDDDLEDYKLETTFEPEAGCILHTSWMQDRAKGIRKIKVKDRWQRRDEIGVGSFGTVYLETTKDGRRRAVKAVRKRQARNFGMAVDHRRELAALTVFSRSKYRQHQIFVEFLGWFEDTDQIFLAMEYFPQGDLSMFKGRIEENDAKVITRQLLEGLQIMHGKGFTHRDLKPNNIFVVQTTPSWWVKIGDFGISKRVRPEDATELRTEAGPIGYQAPEIRGLVANAANPGSTVYTNAVDLWSLGCVLYKIVTKKIPFPSSTELRAFCDNRIRFSSMASLLFDHYMSEGGTGFVESLLKPQPVERPTASQALDHNWLKFDGVSDEIAVDASEMQQFPSPQASPVPAVTPKPIKFISYNGKKYSFPFETCRTWEGMQDMIGQVFLLHTEVIKKRVGEVQYDLLNERQEIILSQVWEALIEPDMTVIMSMWPVPYSPNKALDITLPTTTGRRRTAPPGLGPVQVPGGRLPGGVAPQLSPLRRGPNSAELYRVDASRNVAKLYRVDSRDATDNLIERYRVDPSGDARRNVVNRSDEYQPGDTVPNIFNSYYEDKPGVDHRYYDVNKATQRNPHK